ncbi:MAG: DUF5682 family protein [Chloroflexota bacterium]
MLKSFDLSIFGIRHHGPGSALSMRRGLAEYKPDIILVEGPADANNIIEWLGHKEMEPPVALVLYAPDQPKRASYFPFAEFSPEFQAIRYGLKQDIPVRFMDLPQANMMASEAKLAFPDMDPLQQLAKLAGYPNHEAWWNQLIEQRSSNPEQHDSTLFDAVFELMSIVRAESDAAREAAINREKVLEGEARDSEPNTTTRNPNPKSDSQKRDATGDAQPKAQGETERNVEDEETKQAKQTAEKEALAAGLKLADQREAFMRRTIREARDQGHKRIAIVCGAFHGPALVNLTGEAEDKALLADMPSIDTETAWVPWTYSRLSNFSGYGSGINSPGWYHHLWEMGLKEADPTERSITWLTQVAELLRKERFDPSSAHIIETVRLADALAILRDRPYPGLAELMEATQTVMTDGKAEPLQLIQKKLIISERMGFVPEDSPMVPLQRDLYQQQRRLRLRPEPEPSTLNLDLRQEMHLSRSHLLHRLRLLNIPWGKILPVRNQVGTYREVWRLHWVPELTIKVIEANVWGNTVKDASESIARNIADKASDLPTLTHLLDQIILANLPETIEHLMKCIQEKAALSSNIPRMIDALPPLVQALRYGSVRQTDKAAIAQVVHGLLRRIYIGLPHTCAALADDAAQEMFGRISSVHQVVQVVSKSLDKMEWAEEGKDKPEHSKAEFPTNEMAADGEWISHREQWYQTLKTLADQPKMHGLIAGRSCRLLVDSRQYQPEAAKERLQRALIAAPLQTLDVLQSAFWIEGFLRGSGLVLLHDQTLWTLLDSWVLSIGEENFVDTLPILRRTFADFSDSTRQQLSERIRQRMNKAQNQATTGSLFDPKQAKKVLPLAAELLGIVVPQYK